MLPRLGEITMCRGRGGAMVGIAGWRTHGEISNWVSAATNTGLSGSKN